MSWPLAKLDNHVDILSGFAFKSENFNDRGEGLPLVRIRDVVPGVSDTYYSGEYSSEFLLSDGDLLIGMDGDFNRARWNGGQALLNQRVCKVTAKGESLDQGYLYHFLPKALDKIHAETPAVTVKHLSVKGIRAIEIPLPPLPEQKRIAAILDKADAIRRKRQQAIQLADDFLRAVFLDMFGDPVTNPKGWSKKALKLLGKSATGRTPPSEKADMWGEGLPFVTPGDLSGRVDSSVREVTQEGAEHSKVCRTGSLLVCCIGATIGKVGIAGCPVAFNQQINAQEWGGEISDAYGFFVFKLFPELVRERAIQTTLPILKKSLFDEIEIPVPAKDMQEKFAILAQKISSFNALHGSGAEMPIFESLSQLAFSGKL